MRHLAVPAERDRARIALLAADGLSNSRIAKEVGVSRSTVILWRERFWQGGPDGLTKIAPGRGRPVTYNADRAQIIEATTQSKHPERPIGAPEPWRRPGA